MGSCLCKEEQRIRTRPRVSRFSQTSEELTMSEESAPKRPRIMDMAAIRDLIMEILTYVGTIQENNGDDSMPLSRIHRLADTEEGWCFVMSSLIATIPLLEPLSPTAIKVIFDICPLPPRETIVTFTRGLHLNRAASVVACASLENVRFARNMLLLLDCIADKFAGHTSTDIINPDVLDYLIALLTAESAPALALHSIVTMEKLAATAESKRVIEGALSSLMLHPLLPLELHHDSENLLWRQVGFCARWALDNVFIIPGRQLSYEMLDMTDVRVVLNTHDMSSSLKVSPDGLEARCDSQFFESVRATFKVTYGIWYYEVLLITGGVMQIGWATKQTSFESHEGLGVGDDSFSLGYDGCRRLMWHRAMSLRHETDVARWEPGDVLGCLIDVSRAQAIFSLNGRELPPVNDIFVGSRLNGIEISSDASSEGFYPAASFMAHQQARFNFGTTPFRYPPADKHYQLMNKYGALTPAQKKILPRHVQLQSILRNDNPSDRRCVVCYDSVTGYGVGPCCHSGFCQQCAWQLNECPLCRSPVSFTYQVIA